MIMEEVKNIEIRLEKDRKEGEGWNEYTRERFK